MFEQIQKYIFEYFRIDIEYYTESHKTFEITTYNIKHRKNTHIYFHKYIFLIFPTKPNTPKPVGYYLYF